MAAKILNISLKVIFLPECDDETEDIYEFTDREEAIKIATDEIKRRIEASVPPNSDCSITVGQKIL